MQVYEEFAAIFTPIIVVILAYFLWCFCYEFRGSHGSRKDRRPDRDDAQDRRGPRDEEELIGLEDLSAAADRIRQRQQQQEQQQQQGQEEGTVGPQKPIPPPQPAVLPAPSAVRSWEHRLRAMGGAVAHPSPPPRLPSLSPAPSLSTMMSSSSSLYSPSSSSSSSPSSSSPFFFSYLPHSFSMWMSKAPAPVLTPTTATLSGCIRGTSERKEPKVVRFADEALSSIAVTPATPELKPPPCPSCNEDGGAGAGGGSTASSSSSADDVDHAVGAGDGLPLLEKRCGLLNTEWQHGRIGTAVSAA